MKSIFLTVFFLPIFLNAQPNSRTPLLGLFCSDLIDNNRWCLTFDSTGKVTAQLSGRTVSTVKEDFLPWGFSDTYTLIGDTIKFSSYIEDYGAKDYPVEYRYNYFTVLIRGQELELSVEGKTTTGTKRQQKLLLKKIR